VPYFSWKMMMASSSLMINSFALAASEPDNNLETNQPDEAFLEFLASMDEVDGEMTDLLDMLDVSDELALDEKSDSSVPEKEKSDESEIETYPENHPGSNPALMAKEDK